MNGFPPPGLVETWIYLATNHNSELAHIKASATQNINEVFGSIEIAQLYIDQHPKY
jgi:hypothetical protein